MKKAILSFILCSFLLRSYGQPSQVDLEALDDYIESARNTWNVPGLVARLSAGLHVALEHWHFNTFKGTFNLPWLDPDLFSFELNEEGEVAFFKRGGIEWKKMEEEKKE